MRCEAEELQARAAAGDPVALTRMMVRIPSVNPSLEEGGDGEAILARRCRDWLEAWGYDVRTDEVAPGRHNVVARRTGRGPGKRLILNGHLDTVGVGGMAVPPFDGALAEGRVWGRGACDMKGGLGIILATAARLSGTSAAGELVVALTADEEHASLGMQAFVAHGLRADGAVVCEPTSLAVMPAHKGFLWLEATFRGRAAHGSRPAEGVDAIRHAGRYLSLLERLEARLGRRPRHPLLDRASFHAGTIRGGSAPSVYPQECSLVLERRTLPGEDSEAASMDFQELLDELASEVPELDADLKPGLFRPGTEVAGDSPLVAALLEAIEALGEAPRVEGMTAWVDAAYLNEAGIPAVCFGPGSIAQAHSAREWVSVEELITGARILGHFAERFLAADG